MKLLLRNIIVILFIANGAFSQTATAPASGDGSFGDPYQISTLDNLYWISQDTSQWNKYYIQTADIDASSTSSWDGGAGFTPIGKSSFMFTGHYNGQGFSISGLTINRSGTSYIGMFGGLNLGGSVSNLGLIDADVSGALQTGALAGVMYNSSTISACFVTGTVTASGDYYIGGMVGYISNGAVSNCYSFVDITAATGEAVGGLIGEIDGGSVNNCYSAGSVSGQPGGTYIGGLIGFNNVTVTSSYWDTETSTLETSGGGTGKTTLEMKQQSTFSGWDFSGTWNIADAYSYPYLQNVDPPSVPGYVVAAEPTMQTTQISFSSVDVTSMTVSFTAGNGLHRIVLVKQGSAVDAFPADESTYTANASFSSGTELGTGNYVVYNGTGNSFSLTNLSAETAYHFAVMEFNGMSDGNAPNYLVTSPAARARQTLTAAFGSAAVSALRFDGVNDYIDAGTNSNHRPSDAITLEAWIKPTSQVAYAQIVGNMKDDNLPESGYSLALDGASGIYFNIETSSSSGEQFHYFSSGTNTLTLGVWTHAAATYDGTTRKIYLNGELVATSTISDGSIDYDPSNTLYIGKYQDDDEQFFFPGEIDEVRLWSVARTADQIREFMHRTVTVHQEGLEGYWQLNENTGLTTTENNSGTNGTLTGFNFDSNSGWITSTIPAGNGTHASSSSFSSGTATLGDASLTTTDPFDAAVDLSLTAINNAPNTIPGGFPGVAGDKYFVMNLFGTPGTFSANLTLDYGAGVIDSRGDEFPGGIKLYSRSSTSDDVWTYVGSAASVNSTTGVVTFNGISGFSQFAVVEDESALPVELVLFTVKENDNVCVVQWTTATETNNYGFEVQRSVISNQPSESDSRVLNADGRVWSNAGFVPGNGNSHVEHEYSFVDRVISTGRYSYRLKQIDRDGKFSYSQEVEVTINNTPKEFALMQNYPNPFNPSTEIRYQTSEVSNVSLKVYDAIGREVATLVNEVKEAGSYSVKFSAEGGSAQTMADKSTSGGNASYLASGIYFARLQSGNKVQLKKMLLMK